jgi:hypothetical protein
MQDVSFQNQRPEFQYAKVVPKTGFIKWKVRDKYDLSRVKFRPQLPKFKTYRRQGKHFFTFVKWFTFTLHDSQCLLINLRSD